MFSAVNHILCDSFYIRKKGWAQEKVFKTNAEAGKQIATILPYSETTECQKCTEVLQAIFKDQSRKHADFLCI